METAEQLLTLHSTVYRAEPVPSLQKEGLLKKSHWSIFNIMINLTGSKNIATTSQSKEQNDCTEPFYRLMQAFYFMVRGRKDTSAQVQHTKYLV